MGTVQIDGSTPKLTIGNATAEDATILFDGNAQDFYIALDDSADDLLIGLGSTVGTTPAIAIDENLKVNIPVTTASTSASTGSLTTGGGAGIGADLYVGDDVYLITDSAVLGFGADKDTLLTHTDGTGLTLNSTNKLCFNDASQFVQGSSATVLSIGATDEIDLTATAIDINGTCDVSGTFSLGGTNITTTAAEINLIDGGTARGTTAIVDADGVLINDAGTMRMTTAATLKTYIGGGKVNQVLFMTTTTEVEVDTSAYTDTGLTQAITPSASDSRILIMGMIAGQLLNGGVDKSYTAKILRDSTDIEEQIIERYMKQSDDQPERMSQFFCYVDSPSTTSEITYKVQVIGGNGGTIKVCLESQPSNMTVMEILA
jgi:hypothetical protein